MLDYTLMELLIGVTNRGEVYMQGRTAFITGASRGIGFAIAKMLASKGYHLAVNSRNEEQISEVSKFLSKKYHISCCPISGDISDFNIVEKAFQKIEIELGNLDVLINNAGISHLGLLADMELEEWNRILNINLTSVFGCCKYAIPLMLKKKSGKIINISSVWGNIGASCEVAYSASKGGMNAFTKALAKELAPSNIQVNAIACGAIDTKMNDFFSKEERKELEDEIPTGRFGEVNEVAKLVVSLIESPAYLTGQIIRMDGGWT